MLAAKEHPLTKRWDAGIRKLSLCALWAGLLFLPFSGAFPPQVDWGSAVSGSPRHAVTSPLNTVLSHTGEQRGVRGLPGGAV